MNAAITVFLAFFVAATTAMNLAFTVAPEPMTRLLMDAIHHA